MRFLRQSTAATVAAGPFVSPGTGLAVNSLTTQAGRVVKNGTGSAFTAASWAQDGAAGGEYMVGLASGDTDTVGRFRVYFDAPSTYLPVWEDFSVLSAAVYDSLFGSTALSTFAGGAVASVSGDVSGKILGGGAGTISGVGVSANATQFLGHAVVLDANFYPAVNVVDVAGAAASGVSGTLAANVTQIAGQPASASAPVTFPATVASPTNITAGTITSLTNAPTAGDFTAAMKTSLNAATPASVVGDVGGKVLGGGAGTISGLGVNANTTQFLGHAVALDANFLPGVNLVDLAGAAASASAGAVDANLVSVNGATFAGSYAPANVGEWLGSAPNVLVSGRVDASAGAVADKGGYALQTAPPTAAAVAAAVRDVDNTTPAASSLGAKVNASASAGDPWSAALPGAYSSGQAGFLLGTNLDARVSTRSTYAGGAVASVTGGVGGSVTGSVGSVVGSVGGGVTGSVGSVVGGVGGNVAGTVASVVGAVTLPTNPPADWLNAAAVKADAVTKIQAGVATAAQIPANFTTAAFASAGVFAAAALANAPTGGSAPTAAQVRQEMDANSTKLAVLPASFPANFPALGIGVGGKISGVVLTDACTANTDMRGTDGAAAATSLAALAATVGSAGAGLTAVPKTGFKLAGDGLDAVPVEAGVNARQALSPILAAAAGVLVGAGTGTVVVKGGNVATTRITAATDDSGNRTAVTLALPT